MNELNLTIMNFQSNFDEIIPNCIISNAISDYLWALYLEIENGIT